MDGPDHNSRKGERMATRFLLMQQLLAYTNCLACRIAHFDSIHHSDGEDEILLLEYTLAVICYSLSFYLCKNYSWIAHQKQSPPS
jgi:hypothetical protein